MSATQSAAAALNASTPRAPQARFNRYSITLLAIADEVIDCGPDLAGTNQYHPERCDAQSAAATVNR
jgi:hypothetical protein